MDLTSDQRAGDGETNFAAVFQDDVIQAVRQGDNLLKGVNQRPLIDYPPSFTAPSGQTNTLTPIRLSDPDSGPSTLTAELLVGPQGVQIARHSGAISWNPDPTQAGDQLLVVEVSDSGVPAESGYAVISATVTANNPPQFLQEWNSPLEVPLSGELVLTNAATDPDIPPNTIRYHLEGESYGAVIDPETGVFSWVVPVSLANGSYEFTVVATDDGVPPQAARQSFAVDVQIPSPTPRLELQSVQKGLVRLRLLGTAGHAYRLESSVNLRDWVIRKESAGTEELWEFSETAPAGFYRLVLP